MGLLSTGPLRRTATDVVWCYDPNVKPPDHLVGAGWIDAIVCTLEAGADVVRIRALDADGKAEVDGLMEQRSGAVGRLLARRKGVVSVNGKRGKILDEWLEAVSLTQRDAAYLLALRILADTTGLPLDDYYRTGRVFHGIETVPEEVADDGDGSPKSEAP